MAYLKEQCLAVDDYVRFFGSRFREPVRTRRIRYSWGHEEDGAVRITFERGSA